MQERLIKQVGVNNCFYSAVNYLLGYGHDDMKDHELNELNNRLRARLVQYFCLNIQEYEDVLSGMNMTPESFRERILSGDQAGNIELRLLANMESVEIYIFHGRYKRPIKIVPDLPPMNGSINLAYHVGQDKHSNHYNAVVYSNYSTDATKSNRILPRDMIMINPDDLSSRDNIIKLRNEENTSLKRKVDELEGSLKEEKEELEVKEETVMQCTLHIDRLHTKIDSLADLAAASRADPAAIHAIKMGLD